MQLAGRVLIPVVQVWEVIAIWWLSMKYKWKNTGLGVNEVFIIVGDLVEKLKDFKKFFLICVRAVYM